eukprot:5184514-Ditylum_brightwellii.AAC.1
MLNQKEETCWAELVETTTFLCPTKNLMHGAFAAEDNHHHPMCRVRRKCRLGGGCPGEGSPSMAARAQNLIA